MEEDDQNGGYNAPPSVLAKQYGFSGVPRIVVNGTRVPIDVAFQGWTQYIRDNWIGFDRTIVAWPKNQKSVYLIHSTNGGTGDTGWKYTQATTFLTDELDDSAFYRWMATQYSTFGYYDRAGNPVYVAPSSKIDTAIQLDSGSRAELFYAKVEGHPKSSLVQDIQASSVAHYSGHHPETHSMIYGYYPSVSQ
jgi:hypothetical protein